MAMAPILTLPTELLQSIFSLSDTQTFLSSRIVCRRWHHASATPSVVRDALAKLPPSVITPSLPSLNALSGDAWNSLFGAVCRRNLVRHWRRTQKTTSSKRNTNSTTSTIPVTATSSNGGKIAVLKGAEISVHEHDSGHSFVFVLAQSLYPLWTSICRALLQGSLGGNQGYAKHRLAISSRAKLVAVALGKTIQVYEYGHGHGHGHGPAEYILGQSETTFVSSVCPPPGANYHETDGVVEGLEFAEEDTLLRVTIGKESNPNRPMRVRYLGDPSLSQQQQQQQQQVSLGYWKQALNRAYLDSVALATNLPNNDYKTAFKGLRLLPSSFPGSSPPSSSPIKPSRCFIAALQTQDTQAYCITSTSQSQIKATHLFPSKPTTAAISTSPWESTLSFLEKHTQTDKEITAQNLHRASLSRWDPIHLPVTSTQNPVLRTSEDNRILVVYEPGAGHSFGYLGGGAVYVYNMDPPFLGLDGGGDGKVKVQPWSFLVDIVDVDVEALGVVRQTDRIGSYKITGTARRGQEVIEWCLG